MNKIQFEKRLEEADTAVATLVQQGDVLTKQPEQEGERFLAFYLKQANLSLIAADILYAISTEEEAKSFHRLRKDYEAFLWVINSAYYSMFYTAHALLASRGVRIRSKQGVHVKTGHALLHFCVRSNYIAKELYERFLQGQSEAAELLSLEAFKDRQMELTSSYLYEAEKRALFTYEIDFEAKRKHALTSLNRAKGFLSEIEQILGR